MPECPLGAQAPECLPSNNNSNNNNNNNNNNIKNFV